MDTSYHRLTQCQTTEHFIHQILISATGEVHCQGLVLQGEAEKKEDDSPGIGPKGTWVSCPHGCKDSDCLSCQHMVLTVTIKIHPIFCHLTTGTSYHRFTQ